MTPSPRCTTPSRRGTSRRVPDRRRRAGPATDARHPRASWPRDAVYAAGTPVVIVVMFVVVGGVIMVVVPVIVAIDQAPAALGGRLRGHSADGLLGGCQRIAGTREDWPGGARTLTPREPTREPNGTLWSGPSSIRTATRSGSASPSQDHYSPALLRVSSHRQLRPAKRNRPPPGRDQGLDRHRADSSCGCRGYRDGRFSTELFARYQRSRPVLDGTSCCGCCPETQDTRPGFTMT